MFRNTRIAWSPTRGRLLDNCSRRYVLQHVIGAIDKDVRDKSRKRPIEDFARNGLKDSIIHQIEERDLASEEIRNSIHRNVLRATISGEALDSKPYGKIEQIVELMMHRYEMFASAPLIGFNRKSKNRIIVIDRFQPLLLDGARQYGSPDLIVQNGSRLCLVRLAMEMKSRSPDEASELELGSMILWAERNPMINHELSEIDVVRIGWLGTRWVKWIKPANSEWGKQSRSLISMDIEQMARLMIFRGDLEKLPRSKSKWSCSKCSFKDECPGVEIKEKTQGPRQRMQGSLPL